MMKKVSIIIPIYNEEKTIDDILKKVRASNTCGLKKQIILVDDASQDNSLKKIKKYSKDEDITVLNHEKNRGKGAALRTGFEAVDGDIVLIQDADLEYDPEEYPNLMNPILSGKADVVFGSRFLGHGPHRVVYYWHYVGNKLLTRFSNMTTNLNLTDMETCYKVFRREVLDGMKLSANRFGFEPEFTAKIARKKHIVYEVGISYYGRSYEEGKKITWKDGVSAIWYISKFGIFRRD